MYHWWESYYKIMKFGINLVCSLYVATRNMANNSKPTAARQRETWGIIPTQMAS